MTRDEAEKEAKRRWGEGGYARACGDHVSVGDAEQRAVACGETYEAAFKWAEGKRPVWWYERS